MIKINWSKLRDLKFKLRLNTAEYILAGIMIVLVIILAVMFHGIKQRKYDKQELMYITKSLKLDEDERDSQYKQMMIRILSVYGFKYDRRYKKAMSKEEKTVYIRDNLTYAKATGFGRFDVPIIHQMETAFNPYADGAFDETGIGQVKFPTALFAHKLLQYMPSNLRYLLSFNIKTKKDLYNPLISLKIAYILLWWYKREFKGREEWYVSVYHWGGFLSRRWDNGEGNIPSTFTLNGIEYNVIKYYLTFKEWKTAYESGKLEPGKPIKELWHNYGDKLCKKEIDFRKTKKIIRKMRSRMDELLERDKENRDFEKMCKLELNRMYKELKEIGKKANKKGWKKQYDILKDSISKFLSNVFGSKKNKDKKEKKK